jgi:hypothetical protein
MLYPTELQAPGLLINCWQPIKIYSAIFTIFKTSRKQIRRGRLVIFPFSSTRAVAGLSGAKPEGFRANPAGLVVRRSPDRAHSLTEGLPLRFTSHFGLIFKAESDKTSRCRFRGNGFGFPKRTRFEFSHP